MNIRLAVFASAFAGLLAATYSFAQLPGTFIPIAVSVGGAPACTPNDQGGGSDSNVLGLWHFDNTGNDNSATPTHTLTLTGGATYSTTQSKFGGYALNIVTAATSYAAVASGIPIGTSDFTFEGWVYFAGTSPSLMGMLGDDQTSFLGNFANASISFQVAGTTVSATPTMPTAIPANGWHHFAGVRAAGLIQLYIDGVKLAGGGGSAPGSITANANWKIGRAYSASYVMPAGSFIDEVRISNFARYTANFTPQTLAFCNAVPPPPSSTYRYWRMDITAGTSGPARISEWTMNTSGVNQIPAMTGSTTSGVTISGAGNQGSGYEEWHAADRVPSTFWYSGPSTTTSIKVDLGTSKHIDNYTIQADPNAIGPAGWTLKGSNDDSFYFNIDTQSAQTWTAGQIRSYTPPSYP